MWLDHAKEKEIAKELRLRMVTVVPMIVFTLKPITSSSAAPLVAVTSSHHCAVVM